MEEGVYAHRVFEGGRDGHGSYHTSFLGTEEEFHKYLEKIRKRGGNYLAGGRLDLIKLSNGNLYDVVIHTEQDQKEFCVMGSSRKVLEFILEKMEGRDRLEKIERIQFKS